MNIRTTYFLFFCIVLSTGLMAQEPVNEEINEIIRKHGLDESQAMEIAGWMVDVYGPRLTGSPMLDKATDWAQKTLKDWGMDNVHLESWGPFGRGWEMQHFEMHAKSPSYWPIIAYPKAWSPSTKGEVTGEVIYLQADRIEDLEAYKGKLKGKFVLLDTIRNTKEWFDPLAKRHDSESLLKLANAPAPTPRPRRNFRNLGGFSFNQALRKFLYDEKPLAVLDRSYKGDLGTVFVSRAWAAEGRAQAKDAKVVPQATLAVEHYNRILRLHQKGIKVELTMELKAQYTNPDEMEHNIIAEIPGTDLKDEVVIFGAHFDSWHAGTGATDNGAGSTVMMEAARILLETIKESGVKPRRTLRLALWTGEEQGLLGSRAYVKDHYAEFPPDSYTPQSLKPDQSKVSAYYNLDNGTGRIRGVYMQGNSEVAPIFRSWLKPFRDLEASTLTMSNTGGTDHLAFDAVGIPGFQFIQDGVAYFNRTHHSNMDNFDHLVEEDLAQAATIVASFVFHTAQRDEMLPRKQLKIAEDKADNAGDRRR
ncbi:MAG: M20/M25/M40 family metallo-hydrolase [Saprospiraceae bacterium]|nr:M20/M25/M40 family metallo-hydrolase [Saprospiraceae bacterium]